MLQASSVPWPVKCDVSCVMAISFITVTDRQTQDAETTSDCHWVLGSTHTYTGHMQPEETTETETCNSRIGIALELYAFHDSQLDSIINYHQ